MSEREAPAPTLDEKLQRPTETGGGARATYEQLCTRWCASFTVEKDPKGQAVAVTLRPYGMHVDQPGQEERWTRVDSKFFERQP